jgi:hypothetical protein
MTRRQFHLAAAVSAVTLAVAACKTTQTPAPSTAGEVSAAPSTGSSGGGSSSVPTLVSVNLQNVLNDLSVAISVDRANIPVNAQVPIDVAANVCGVSVSALAASIASGQAGCTATTTSPQLTQLVQQQVAAGGSVTGGPQTQGAPTNNQM